MAHLTRPPPLTKVGLHCGGCGAIRIVWLPMDAQTRQIAADWHREHEHHMPRPEDRTLRQAPAVTKLFKR